MTKRQTSAMQASMWALAGTTCLVIVGIFGSQVGGIQLRTASTLITALPITIVQPAVPGTLATVRWEPVLDDTRPVIGLVRAHGIETPGSAATLAAGQVSVPVPCTGEEEITVLVREVQTQQVLANTAVSLLPPGQDCLNQ